MVTYKIVYDIVQDAYNWYMAIMHWNQVYKIKDAAFQKMATQIKDDQLPFTEVKKMLVTYIKKRNDTLSLPVEKFQKITAEQLGEKFHVAIKKLEHVTNHTLAVKDCAKNRAREIAKINPDARAPKENLLLLITTFPNMPVYYEEGVIYLYAYIDNKLWGMPLDGILHELMHFQTNFYYRKNLNSSVSKLSDHDYYVLKESLTALLDESWKPLITLPDCSYPQFQPLRDKLVAYYKKHQDFDQLMKYGATEVTKFAQSLK